MVNGQLAEGKEVMEGIGVKLAGELTGSPPGQILNGPGDFSASGFCSAHLTHALVLAPMICDGLAPNKSAQPAIHFHREARYRCGTGQSKVLAPSLNCPSST